ncbi:MAG: DNA translocase FtsK 4TM domain-containing protein [Puniceicoccales bacterium]|nr:DNA translocase FtsK 4TM domain-containing protein [Puniceicoccales bacterium]
MPKPEAPLRGVGRFFWSLGLFLIAALAGIALVDFQPQQSAFVSTAAARHAGENLVGSWGIFLSFWGLRILGLGWPLLILIGLWYGLFPLLTRGQAWGWSRRLATLGLLSCAAALGRLYERTHCLPAHSWPATHLSAGLGGLWGHFWENPCFRALGLVGSWASLLSLGLASACLLFSREASMGHLLHRRGLQLGRCILQLWRALVQILRWTGRCLRFALRLLGRLGRALFRRRFKKVPDDNLKDLKKEKTEARAVPRTPVISRTVNISPVPIPPAASALPSREIPYGRSGTADAVGRAGTAAGTPSGFNRHRGDYLFPPLDLLERGDAKQLPPENCAEVAEKLVETLAQFGVSVHAGEIHCGPVITRYDLTPEVGVRVEKILSLDKNIALNLAARSVRILAPVPGRGCVGIEIPNRHALTVRLREILNSEEWAQNQAEIPIVLGRTVTGEPLIQDLARMPHLLIAGATGAGKTVCLNAIIASLLYHATPDDLRFLMVDPKIVEMQGYNQLPHMLIPVVTDPKKVPNALKWLIGEMEQRYQIFARAGVRNLAGFNAKILQDREAQRAAAAAEQELSTEERQALRRVEEEAVADTVLPEKKLPTIVCIIDEIADLMMVAPSDIETGIARLAQLARAAGIHLILATQRPSVNVITGIIKANLPCRIAFKVASKVDSRTILDTGGAETLLGYGDMLVSTPGPSGILRAQGALVSDGEIEQIVSFLRERNGEPRYAQEVQEQIDLGGDSDPSTGEEWEDELIPQALGIIRSHQHASTSFLQRKLKIGYNRAARIMELLREKGLVHDENLNSDAD